MLRINLSFKKFDNYDVLYSLIYVTHKPMNPLNIFKCYCDASFHSPSKTAVVGWQIGNNPIKIIIIHNTNNTRAEILGFIDMTKNFNSQHHYVIYTDCLTIVNRLKIREELIKNNFSKKHGQKSLANADLYKKLFESVGPNIEVVHIPGHMPGQQMNADNQMFSKVDKLVRKKLRELVKRRGINSKTL